MADLKLTLGDFVFQDFEIPEHMPFGGEQHLAVHQLVGGARQVDAMGPNYRPLRWAGRFRGQTAELRARYLDSLRVAGKPLKLTWHQFAYMVVIRSFRPDMHRLYEIPYTIDCEVVEDLTKPIRNTKRTGLIGQLQDDLNKVNTLVDLIADNPLTQAVGEFSAALSLLPGGSRISRAIQQKLLYPLQYARERTNVLVGSTNSVLEAGGAVSDAASLESQSATMDQMSNLLSINWLLGRMSNNIGAGAGGNSTLTVGGGNLFDLAAKQYSDPTEWTTIANANGLTDPMVAGTADLEIPALPDSAGGILNA